MRISAGTLKGKKIGTRKLFTAGSGTVELRPTSAKVREALFDILRSDITGASFLDLYAGSGAVGFEALSRGAGKTCFVENDQQRTRAIQELIRKADLGNTAAAYQDPVMGFLDRADRSIMVFDLIFADPPYASAEINDVLSFIDNSRLLQEGGSVIIEHASKKPLDASGLTTLRLIKSYRYGDTMLTRYRKVI
ncbi:MAG: 16S rRNA (guanine(966)-N(2))-methyltransferase RsmD [Thermodesulfovibrio sp.]|nr:16S rRNA (guanine(966)-N(2))-methyltransferase RsmD [Thermodesulfovibrio sp.]